jgi:hypothetical protein
MAYDEQRLFIETSLGSVTITRGYGGSANLIVDDDSTGDTEKGFGSRATAYLGPEQIAELIEFLGKLIAS